MASNRKGKRARARAKAIAQAKRDIINANLSVAIATAPKCGIRTNGAQLGKLKGRTHAGFNAGNPNNMTFEPANNKAVLKVREGRLSIIPPSPTHKRFARD